MSFKNINLTKNSMKSNYDSSMQISSHPTVDGDFFSYQKFVKPPVTCPILNKIEER